jgi:hypothetical protein
MGLLREPAKWLLLGGNQQATGGGQGRASQSSVQTRYPHQKILLVRSVSFSLRYGA